MLCKAEQTQSGGGQEPIATVPMQQASQFDDEDDFDEGFRPLIISTDESPSDNNISDQSNGHNHSNETGTSLATEYKIASGHTKSDEKFTSRVATVNTLHSNHRPILNTLNKTTPLIDSRNNDSVPEKGPEADTASSSNEFNSELDRDQERPLTGYSSNTDSVNAMTLGAMDYASDDSQGEFGAGRLIISPAVYRGQNTPIPKPRQPTPSKTRRKSDKIVPVVTAEGQKYICPVCKVCLKSNNELTGHIRSHNTASAVNTCTICGKVLSSQSSLDRHMLVHSGERPFNCKICDMSFTTNGNMHRHMRIHEKEGTAGNSPANSIRSNSPKDLTRDLSKNKSRRSRAHIYDLANSSSLSGGGVKRKHSSDDDTPPTSLSSHAILLGMECQENSYLMDRENAEQLAQSPDKTPVQGHLPQEEETDTLCCPMCMKTFMCKYGLDTHFESHDNEPGCCQICQVTLPSSRLVYLHYFIAHVDRKKLKEFAQTASGNKNGLTPLASGFHELSFTEFSTKKFAQIAKVWCEQNQRRSNSIYQNFHCRKCDHAFPSAEVLRLHSEMHPDVCDVTCKACDVTLTTKEDFEDHMIEHSSERVIDIFSKTIGTDDNDIQDMISQPEFLLCLGLKSNKTNMDWCNKNAIDRAASRYESQITAPVQSKPVNTVTPIVIQPEGDLAALPHLSRAQIPAGSVKLFGKNTIPHPAFPARLPMNKAKHMRKSPVEISDSSDNEAESEAMENSIDVKPWQCIICEFAFSTRNLCDKHCRSDHGLETTELQGAIKHNPFSGTRRINPALSLMPYLCKKCTNGFSNKDNCIRHLQRQHKLDGINVLQHIATNKRLNEGALQPSYMAGVKDAREMMLRQKVAGGEAGLAGAAGAGSRMGTAGSAFSRPSPSAAHAPSNLFSSPAMATYITTPPISPFVKNELNDNDQPLDFSMKKEPQPCDFSTKSTAPKAEVQAVSDEMPMDLSCKADPSAHESTSRVAVHNVVSMSSAIPTPNANHVNLGNHLAQQHNTQRPLYRCKHCPATYATKANIESHILNAHPQVHGPLFVNTGKQQPNSTQSSPALPQRDRQTSPNSDSDLTSVSRMLECTSSASKFGAFFSPTTEGNDASSPRGSRYLNSGDFSNNTSPSPIHALQQFANTHPVDESTDLSLNTSPEANSTCDEPPMKKKRNSYSDSPHKLQCPYCPRAFPWISSLKRHILTHTGQKPFKCPECPVTFSTKSNRERHMSRKHGLDIQDADVRMRMEKPYKCHTCEETFTSAGHTKDHYKAQHEGIPIPDYISQQAKFELLASNQAQDKLIDGQVEAMSVVSDMSDLTNSLVDLDEDEDEEADGEKMARAVTTATAAMTTSPSPTPFSRNTSPLSAAIPDKYALPLEDEAPEYLTKINPERDNYNVDRITGCWKCGLQFDSRKILLRHLKDHNIDHSYKCYLCDASFETRVDCLRHTESVHRHDWVLLREKNKCYNIVDYAANVEKQVLETLANLGLNADGEEIEGAPKPAVDDKNNADSDYAQRKVFCSFCVKRFWSLQDLRRHMRSHTGERPFECDVCQKRFTLKHSMMRHRRKHTSAELASAANTSSSANCTTSPHAQSDDEIMSDLHHGGVDTDDVINSDSIGVSGAMPAMSVAVPNSVVFPGAGSILGDMYGRNNDLLHNLLGVDSSQLEEVLATRRANDAAKLLGMG